MSLASQVTALASRVATEFKSVRSSIASLATTVSGKADAATALVKDSTPGAEWRTPALMTGGGTLSVTGYAVSWTQRLIVMGNGRHALWGTSGFFEMTMPTENTIITGVAGASDLTVTGGAIALPSWVTLYYILPIGGGSASVSGNFRVVGYTANSTPIPDNWVPIVVRNGDSGIFRWGNGISLYNGQSWSAAGGYSQIPTTVQSALDAQRPTNNSLFSSQGAVTTFTGTQRYYVPVAGTITLSNASLGTAGSTATTVLIKKNGLTVHTDTIAASANVVTNTAAVSVAAGDYLTVDVTAAGTGASDLVVLVRTTE